MDKQHKFLALLIMIIMIGGFALRPMMLERKAISRATETVTKILEYWKHGDAATGRNYWANPETFPVIYDLSSYQILNKTTEQIGKDFYTKIEVKIDFAPGSLMPGGRVWIFECRQVNTITSILNFYTAE